MEYTVFTEKPKVICLCGSTRFCEEFYRQRVRLELEGNIVLTITVDRHSDEEIFAIFQCTFLELAREAIKTRFTELHMRKIELCDELFVLNKDGYIGDGTHAEIEYAESICKPISYLECSD